MLYLNDALYEWLNTASPATKWYMGNQNIAPPKPQFANSFGYYTVTDMHVLSMGNEKHTYLPEDDRTEIKIRNTLNAHVRIDIYSRDTTDETHAGDIIVSKVVNYVYSKQIKEYFFENNVGFSKKYSFICLL